MTGSGDDPTQKRKYGLDPDTWQAAKAEMRHICIGVAKACTTITYGELADKMQVVSPHPGSYVFQALLREMCHDDEAAGHVMLCALVVSKATGLPGQGYFKMSIDTLNVDDLETQWRQDLEQVYAYWADRDIAAMDINPNTESDTE